MEIIYIHTENVFVAKDMLVKTAIKAGMQYVEMENEVLIEGNYLFKIVKKEEVRLIDLDLFDVLSKSMTLNPSFVEIDDEHIFLDKNDDFPKFKKNDYKVESINVKKKVKTKINYNRRKY